VEEDQAEAADHQEEEDNKNDFKSYNHEKGSIDNYTGHGIIIRISCTDCV
jgi:hypothetical protein